MKLTPEELRRAYASATNQPDGDHPTAEALARLLLGNVTDAERERLVGHLAACSRCAEEVRVARPIGNALSGPAGGVASPVTWWRRAALLAAAATVLAAAGIALRVGRPSGPSSEPYRAAESPGVRSLVPSGSRLRRDAFVLRWSGSPAGATFEVVLANTRLDVIARMTGLHAPEVTVPAAALAAIPAGSTLVWQVTTVLPDGSRSASPSFAVRLE